MPSTVRPSASLIARCRCGGVEVEASGVPITSLICHCKDCEAGAQQIEVLPSAGRIREPDGGVGYLAYRKDRVRIRRGAELLRAYKLRQNSATNRMVATCCNSAVVLTFDDAKHWVDVFQAAVVGDVPPLQMRICIGNMNAGAFDSSVPAFKQYPFRLVAKIVAAKIAMMLERI